MAISLASLQRSTDVKPPRILIYGVSGVGKTTLAASAPSPVFILTEDGLGALDVPHFSLATSFDDILQAQGALYTEPHEFKTVVVDSLDWLEPLVWKHVCERNGWPSIGQRLAGRAVRGDPVFPDRPAALGLAAAALSRANIAIAADRLDLAKEAWKDVERYLPAHLLSRSDPTFSDVWAAE